MYEQLERDGKWRIGFQTKNLSQKFSISLALWLPYILVRVRTEYYIFRCFLLEPMQGTQETLIIFYKY
jgi:hypothetical protein